MAKWGEGDPRWIVEERADATNVNNWHWTEKNATSWSRDKLKSLLEGFEVEDDKCRCKIKEFSKLDGEATVNNRKAKLIFFFEWDIKLEWEGTYDDGEKTYKGAVQVPNLSDENDADDLDIEVSCKSDKSDAYKLKEFMHKRGRDEIRAKLAEYMRSLKEEFSQGMILPTQKGDKPSTKKMDTSNKENIAKKELSQPVTKTSSSTGLSAQCGRITEKEEFKCRAYDLYRALTEAQMVQAFTRSPCTLDAQKGGQFIMFDGNVLGEFVDLEPHKQLVLKWRFQAWPAGHFSTVTLFLKEKEDCTELQLTQTGVPNTDLERTKEGWKRHYWEAIKQTFGFGARLF